MSRIVRWYVEALGGAGALILVSLCSFAGAAPSDSGSPSDGGSPSDSGSTPEHAPGAESQPPPGIEEARERFRRATELESAGRWSEAAHQLRLALEVKETPGLRFHLAYCEEQQGHYVEALVGYRRAKELIARGEVAQDVAELVEPALERVDGQVSRLEIVLEARPKGLQIKVDGRRAEPGATTELNPGRHQLELTAPGWDSVRRSLVLKPGHTRLPVLLRRTAPEAEGDVVEPTRTEEPVRAPPKKIPKETRQFSAKTWTLALESVALGGAIAAGIAFALRADTEDEHAELTKKSLNADGLSCKAPTGNAVSACAQLREFERARDDADLYSSIAFVGAGVTASAIVLTALLWPSERARSAVAVRHVVPVGPRASAGLSTQFEF